MYATHGLATLSLSNPLDPPVPTQPGRLVWGSFAWVLSHHPNSPVSAAGETEATFYLLSLEY